MRRKGFTLLEVLVAGGVLFIVSSAVVGLSNSIIQGTSRNSDLTVINRWASEGLELTNKVRSDSVLVGGTSSTTSGEKIWFPPAADWQTTYGWYILKDPVSPTESWTLEPVSTTVHLATNSVPNLFQTNSVLPLNSQGVEAYRLICVEAYRATSTLSGDDYIDCNRADSPQLQRATDGSRTSTTNCQADDLFCTTTEASLNRNRENGDQIIPPGNTVKIRSVMVWQDRSDWQSTELATILTNWKGSEQN